MHKYHKIVFIASFNVLRLITVLGAKSSKTLISAKSVNKYHKLCSLLI